MPQVNEEKSAVTLCAAGWQHNACVTDDGKLYTWGVGTTGCLGIGSRETIFKQPVLVEQVSQCRVVNVASSNGITLLYVNNLQGQHSEAMQLLDWKDQQAISTFHTSFHHGKQACSLRPGPNGYNPLKPASKWNGLRRNKSNLKKIAADDDTEDNCMLVTLSALPGQVAQDQINHILDASR